MVVMLSFDSFPLEIASHYQPTNHPLIDFIPSFRARPSPSARTDHHTLEGDSST